MNIYQSLTFNDAVLTDDVSNYLLERLRQTKSVLMRKIEVALQKGKDYIVIYDYCRIHDILNVLHSSMNVLVNVNNELLMLRKLYDYFKSIEHYIVIQRSAATQSQNRDISIIDLSDDTEDEFDDFDSYVGNLTSSDGSQ